MITLFGRSGDFLLFSDDEYGVVVDSSLNMVENIGPIDALSSLMTWEASTEALTETHLELAAGALADLDIRTVTASGRLYTIPKAVQEEAKRGLEWRKEEGRGGTPVGLNTARTLANGGQIGLQKIRHIAKYFPRHEVDKKGKGYKPAQEGFPSNGRIAWALWGGDAGWRWAKTIVERENKKSLAASGGYVISNSAEDIYSVPHMYDADTSAFRSAYEMSGDIVPEFVGRARLDGTGFDRLYKVDTDGIVHVWDGSGWDDLGHIDSDILTLDRTLDDLYDTVEKRHCLLDVDAALIISAHLQQSPFDPVSIYDIDEDEAETVLSLALDIDWDSADMSLVAAPQSPITNQDGNYTPEERSAKASKQVRDKTGRFVKSGERMVVAGDKVNGQGTITSVNNATGKATVKLDNGNEVEVAGDLLEQADSAPQPEKQERLSGPLDLSGIIGEPRPPIDRPKARLSGALPALTPRALSQVINDYPAWIMAQRRSLGKKRRGPAAKDQKSVQTPGDNAGRTEKSDYLKGLEKSAGKSLWTAPATAHPLLQDFFNKPGNSLYYQPITSAGETVAKKVEEAAKTGSKKGVEMTPVTSDVEPIYMAVVSPDDPRAVFDLISIVPASSTSTQPAVYKRADGEWTRDDQILTDLKSPTPPPVVPIVGEELMSVLEQVDSSVPDKDTSSEDEAVTAAGGLDRNRGGAEKLRRYWLYGRGALKIRWNTPGDWTRCYRNLSKYMGPRAKGYCSLRHKEATGVWPGSKYNVGKNPLKRAVRGTGIDSFDILSEDEYMQRRAIRATVADARDRVLRAGGAPEDAAVRGGSKFMIPIVIPEGVETGDGRQFRKGSITMRPLPLPLLWQIKTAQGHDGSVVVGRIDRMERVDGGIGNAYGQFDSGPYGQEAERLVKDKFIRGVSADLDLFEALTDKDNEEDDEFSKKKKMGGDKMDVTKARVMAVTIVPKPAFKECEILIVDDESDADSTEETEEHMIPDGVYVDQVDAMDAEALVACGVVAGAIPTVPPASWMQNPRLKGATPLTVTDEGQVYGHIASWVQDHIGMSMGTRPPRSKSGYAYFNTGSLRADDGKDYPVGQLTLAGGHAPLEASAIEAARHYDDTASAVADVRAGEDAYGIWVAGALRPGVTPDQIRALRASAPSGDWRPIRGSLELVAVCQVNVPGFPIARARVASGQVYALVAAGAATLARMKSDPIRELTQRIEALEAEKIASGSLSKNSAPAELSLRERAEAARAEVLSAGEADLRSRAEALAARVSSVVAAAKVDSDDDLRKRAEELSARISTVVASLSSEPKN
jgi:hypothetical protein